MGCGFTFIHCADLHLGSRFWGWRNKDEQLGKKMFESTFNSFKRIVDLGIREADFMVISGDIYDELVETPRTRMFFASEIERFEKPCFIVTGNHDHTHSWSQSIPYPKNVIQFPTAPSKTRFSIGEAQVEVVGVSFDGPHTDENLVAKIRGTPGVFSIGVVHCSVSSVGDGSEYAPCRMEDFLGKDIQYWALGHIHKRMVLRDSEPMVVYPGNIQGRDINESGEKGCMLVRVDGGNVDAEFVPTQDLVWKEVAADITGKNNVNELIESVKKDIPKESLVALNFVGKGPLNHIIRQNPEDIADIISIQTGGNLFVRKVVCGPELDLEKEENSGTLLSEVIRESNRLFEHSEEEILDLLCPKGPAEDLRMYLEYFARHNMLHELITEAKLSVIDRLTGAKE